VFSRGTDKEATVYFEWEGAPGKHRFEGVWRNPAGEIEVITRFEFEARGRQFGGFWKLPLNPTMAPGPWLLEARVDGAQAGTFTIEVRADGEVPHSSQPATGAMTLTTAAAYGLLQQQAFRLEALDPGGTPVAGGLGVIVDGLGLLTAFQAIDGATTIRVTSPSGQSATVDHLLAWNRDQDVAVLPLPAADPPAALLSRQPLHQVGDRVYTLAVGEDDTRTIIDTTITGLGARTRNVKRVTLSLPATRGAAGAPVINEAGSPTRAGSPRRSRSPRRCWCRAGRRASRWRPTRCRTRRSTRGRRSSCCGPSTGHRQWTPAPTRPSRRRAPRASLATNTPSDRLPVLHVLERDEAPRPDQSVTGGRSGGRLGPCRDGRDEHARDGRASE